MEAKETKAVVDKAVLGAVGDAAARMANVMGGESESGGEMGGELGGGGGLGGAGVEGGEE